MVTARPVAILIGPPGAGKTTIGRLLAERLGVAWHDTDAAIVQEHGRPIADIFVVDGEPAFRTIEHDAVTRALAGSAGVVSLGGGAPMEPGTKELLAGHTVVFLDVAIADAAQRVGFDRSRPLLGVNPRAQWTKIMATRRPTYEALATHRVDTAGRQPAEVVDEILRLLGSRP